MPVFNEFEEHGHEVRALLADGETLLALTLAEPAYGSTGKHDPDFADSKRGRRYRDRGRGVADAVDKATRRSWPLRAVTRLGVFILGLLSWSPSWDGPGALVRRVLGGRVVVGEPGSLARAMQAEFSPYGDGGYLAVTDTHLHVFKQAGIFAKHAIATEPPQWTVDRAVVANARRAPRVFARARIELTFTDGSHIVLSQGPFHSGGWHATQVVNALA